MQHPLPTQVVMSSAMAEFFLRLPKHRDIGHILTDLLEVAMGATSSAAGVVGISGDTPFEVRRGEFDDGLRRYEKEWCATLEAGQESSEVCEFVTARGRAGLGTTRRTGDLAIYMLLAKAGTFETGHRQAAAFLLEGASAGIVNVRELMDVSRKLGQLDLVHSIGRAMNSILDVKELLDQIMEMGRLTMKAAACAVMLVDEERRELVFEVAKGEAGSALQQYRMPIDAGIAGWIATHGEAVIINDVSKDPRHYRQADQTSGFSTQSLIGAPLLTRGKVIGVMEVVNKLDGSDFDKDDLELLNTLASDAAVAIDNASLYRAVLGGYVDTIRALAAAIDAKDPYTRGHSERVTQYSLLAAEALALPREERERLRYAAVLHDVGKIGIDDRILRKPAPLDKDEWEIMCTHVDMGAQIVDNIEFLAGAKPLIRGHHERFDASGYPDGLMGQDIPLGARIIAVADSFDTMTTDRPYRKSPGVDFALNELRRCSGTQFDPEVAEAFIGSFEAKKGSGA